MAVLYFGYLVAGLRADVDYFFGGVLLGFGRKRENLGMLLLLVLGLKYDVFWEHYFLEV
jgi:hypothetical protein